MSKTNYDLYLEKQMKDPEYRCAYEAEKPKYELIKRIIAARLEKNLTQKQLAEKIGTKQAHIARFESGNYNPSLLFLQRLAAGLGKKLQVGLG